MQEDQVFSRVGQSGFPSPTPVPAQLWLNKHSCLHVSIRSFIRILLHGATQYWKPTDNSFNKTISSKIFLLKQAFTKSSETESGVGNLMIFYTLTIKAIARTLPANPTMSTGQVRTVYWRALIRTSRTAPCTGSRWVQN